MTVDDLQEEIIIERELIEGIICELFTLSKDLASREPAVREKTVAAVFLSQFYSGFENILI